MKQIFCPYIRISLEMWSGPVKSFRLLNPLWLLVALAYYPTVYLWYFTMGRRKVRQKDNYCTVCGKNVGNSMWSFCSEECLMSDPTIKPWTYNGK